MIRRHVHVGRMQYAPTLPTEKAIPNDWFRVKVLRTTECLSAAPDESPPLFQRPIRRSRRKPSTISATYLLHQTKARRTTEYLSATPDDSLQQFR